MNTFNSENKIEANQITDINKFKESQVSQNLLKENKKRCLVDFKNTSDFVENKRTNKLESPWIGPFSVIDSKPEFNIAQVDMGNKIQWISYRKLKPAGRGSMSCSKKTPN